MTNPEIRSVIVEREIAFPPEKIWRALTTPHLVSEWLMKTDFKLVLGEKFKFTQDWGSIDCEMLEIEPHRTLSYRWDAFGLESVVTFTLTATGGGTQLRVEQAGFRTEHEQAYRGSRASWPGFLAKLEALVGREQ